MGPVVAAVDRPPAAVRIVGRELVAGCLAGLHDAVLARHGTSFSSPNVIAALATTIASAAW